MLLVSQRCKQSMESVPQVATAEAPHLREVRKCAHMVQVEVCDQHSVNDVCIVTAAGQQREIWEPAVEAQRWETRT